MENYCNKENIVTTRSVSVPRARQKGSFFYRVNKDRKNKMWRNGMKEWCDWIVDQRTSYPEARLFWGRDL